MSTKHADLYRAVWRKSTRSGGNGDCVELAGLHGGQVAVRDSKNPSSGLLAFDLATWAAFAARVRCGQVDL
jgi:hypothetical protein